MKDLKIKKIDGKEQRFIVIGLITSDEFLTALYPILEKNHRQFANNLFTGFYCDVINWCLDFYQKYSVSPKSNIKSIRLDDEEKNKLIHRFLKTIDDFNRNENFNERYSIDKACDYIRKKNIDYIKNQLNLCLENDDYESAEDLVKMYEELESHQEGIDRFNLDEKDDKDIDEILNPKNQRVFKYHGLLGDIVRVYRGDLLSFIGPSKRGKTWFLLMSAFEACIQQYRVVFFSFEMDKIRIKKRFYQMLSNSVDPDDHPGKTNVDLPIKEFSKKNDCYELIESIENFDVLNHKGITKAKKRFKMIRKKGNIEFICPPNASMSVKGIKKELDDLIKKKNFVPDVIILDYADIIKASFKTDHRNEIDDVWKGIKGLAQATNTLVITASHANNRTTSKGKDIDEGDVVEDQRKLNHVSAMVAINQIDAEKQKGITRLSVMASRHKKAHKGMTITVTQCLDIGKPYIDAVFTNKLMFGKADDKERNKSDARERLRKIRENG